MLRHSCRTVFFNEALRQEVKEEELGLEERKGRPGLRLLGAGLVPLPRQLDNNAGAHLKTTAPRMI
ncbi:hypothetical protein DPMN_025934 [Dreissena polymorpha]|uniref:Uncharacterized protein n=1 Tax=Dreissena polymorpha TaxID=45954 RepID=A0A9D4LSA4_DREPO|nr:hypothetical protein DPMN_025934 [Dreissena polymorpha]